LAPVVQSISVRDIFKPIKGTYRLRSKASGHYWAVDELGHEYLTRHLNSSSEWKITIYNPPQAEIMNRRTKAGPYQDGRDARAEFHLDADGLHYKIFMAGQILTAMDDGSAVWGDLAPIEKVSNDTEDLAAGSLWSMEWVERCWYGTCYRTRSGQYGRQWKMARDFNFFRPAGKSSGSLFKWKDLCGDTKKDCYKSYYAWRRAFVMDDRLSEDSKYHVTQSGIQSICDMPITFLKGIAQTERVIQAALEVSSENSTCRRLSSKEVSTSFYQALEVECLNPCLEVIQKASKDLDCRAGQNYTQFFQGVVVTDACMTVSAPTLEALLEFSMKKNCWTWSPPSPLWYYNDKGPDRITSSPAVCTVDSNRRKDIQRNGQCIEGTTCQCPRRAAGGHKTTSMIRGDAIIFVEDGFATLPSIVIRRLTRDVQISVARWVVTGGWAASSSYSATLLALPLVLAKSTYSSFSMVLMGLLWGYFNPIFQERCSDNVACWPARVSKAKNVGVSGTKRACRQHKSAQNGGSELWFMPPPGLKLTHKKWSFFNNCKVAPCTKKELLTQRVAFGRSDDDKGYTGRPNVYNCQPLNFEDMSADEKGAMVQELQKTIEGEYDITELQKQYPPPM